MLMIFKPMIHQRLQMLLMIILQNVGPNLASNINAGSTHFTEFLPPTCEITLFFIPTDNNEIFNIVKHLKSTKSSGHDGLSVHFLKQIIYFIATPLTHIFNLYLYQLVNILTR